MAFDFTPAAARQSTPRAQAVKRANRALYDAVAHSYEAIDGRRNPALLDYIHARLAELARRHGDDQLLDLGAGRGLVGRAAACLFHRVVSLDLSPAILASAGPAGGTRVAADLDALPFSDGTVNVVTCFAVLHHLPFTAAWAREVARVLRPGGGLWTDHDMDAAFYRRFRTLLGIYRALRGADRRYRRATGIDARTYALAECGESGVDSDRVCQELRDVGLDAAPRFHWYGLNPVTSLLFRTRCRPRGRAPLLSIFATKPALEIGAPAARVSSDLPSANSP